MGIDMSSFGPYSISISTVVEMPDEPEVVEEGIDRLFVEGTIEFLTTILEDESGTFELIFGIDERDIDDLVDVLEERDIGSGADDWCDEVENIFDDLDQIPGFDDSSFNENDDGATCSMIFEFDDFDDLEELYENLGLIEVDDLKFDSDGNIDYVLVVEFADLAFQSVINEDADVEYLWSVVVPGKISETNADETADAKGSWELDTDDSTDVELTAEKGGIPLMFIFIGVGVLVLLVGGGLGAFFLIRGLSRK
jgi:hypothetical protein